MGKKSINHQRKEYELNATGEGTVSALAFGGEGIVRLERFVVFLPLAAPGDTVRFQITERKRNFARGQIETIVKPSPDRVSPPCPIYHECGGCQLQHLDYMAALRHKSKTLEELLRHQIGIDKIPVEPPLDSPPYAYRNKMQLAVSRDSNGKISLGLYRPKTHDVADMPTCLIQEEANNKLLDAFRRGMKLAGWEPELIRHFLSRCNRKGETYAVVIATSEELPGWQDALDELRKASPQLQGFALNVNSRRTNVVLGEKTKILWGKDFLEETAGDFRFRMGPTSFFQVNSLILESLTKKILEWAELRQEDSVLDLYCGVGTFTIPMGKIAKRIVGVEENPESVVWGKENASRNGVPQAEFFARKAEDCFVNFKPEEFSIVFLDPPRKGLSLEALKGIIKLMPRKILYLSCNPPTLARDLKHFLAAGWEFKRTMAVDLFPQTAQIEALALLERRERS